jgi:hypothetical protein
VGGKFGSSAAVGVVLPPAPQMVEKQGWTYVSRSNQLVRGAHEPQTEITCVAFSQVGWGWGGAGLAGGREGCRPLSGRAGGTDLRPDSRTATAAVAADCYHCVTQICTILQITLDAYPMFTSVCVSVPVSAL